MASLTSSIWLLRFAEYRRSCATAIECSLPTSLPVYQVLRSSLGFITSRRFFVPRMATDSPDDLAGFVAMSRVKMGDARETDDRLGVSDWWSPPCSTPHPAA